MDGWGCLAIIVLLILPYFGFKYLSNELGLGLSEHTLYTLVPTFWICLILWIFTVPKVYKSMEGTAKSLFLSLLYMVVTGLIIFFLSGIAVDKFNEYRNETDKPKTEVAADSVINDQSTYQQQEIYEQVPIYSDNSSEENTETEDVNYEDSYDNADVVDSVQ